MFREFQAQPGEGNHTYYNPGAGARTGHGKNPNGPSAQRSYRLLEPKGRIPAEITCEEGQNRCPEHRPNRAEAYDHQHHDGHEGRKVVPISASEGPHRFSIPGFNLLRAKALGIKLHHEKNGPIIKNGRHHRHLNNLEVGDFENLRNEKGSGPQYRRVR